MSSIHYDLLANKCARGSLLRRLDIGEVQRELYSRLEFARAGMMPYRLRYSVSSQVW